MSEVKWQHEETPKAIGDLKTAVELLKHNIEKERVLEESIDDVLAEIPNGTTDKETTKQADLSKLKLKEQIAQLRQKNKLLNKEIDEITAKLAKSEEEHFALTNDFTTADEGSVVKLRDAYRHMQCNLRAAAVREHKKLYSNISLPLADHSMVAYNKAKASVFTELKSITDKSLYQLQMLENNPHNHNLSQNYLLLIRSLHDDHKLSEDVRSEIEEVLTKEYRVLTSQAPKGIPESIKEYYAALAKFSWDCVARAIPLVMSTDYNKFDEEMHEAREVGDDDDDHDHEGKGISYIYPVLLTSSNWPREVALKGKVVLKANG